MLRMTEMKCSSVFCRALLLKWQVFGLVLVALGRAVVRGERTHARGAWEMAHHLEIAAHAAAHELGVELSEAAAAGAPDSDEGIAALEHLAFIRTLFLILALFAKHMQVKLAGRGALYAPGMEFMLVGILTVPARTDRPAYLDSS